MKRERERERMRTKTKYSSKVSNKAQCCTTPPHPPRPPRQASAPHGIKPGPLVYSQRAQPSLLHKTTYSKST